MHVQHRWEFSGLPGDISEIPPLYILNSNPWALNQVRGQYLVGSLSGADASKKVTEAPTKVGYSGMATREIV